MKTIGKTLISSIRVIAGTIGDYDIRYRDLQKKIKENNLFTLFAEPLVVGKEILWQTPLNGTITKYDDLSPEKQKFADSILQQKANEVIACISDTMEMSKIKEYLTFPTNNDKYLINTDTGDNVIITQWGCVSDDADVQAVSIIKDEKLPVPVIFLIRYTDGTPAPNEDIFIYFNNKLNPENSGSNAGIDFGKVIMGTKIKVFQTVKDKEMFIHTFIVDNRVEYIVEIPPLQTMRFIVKNTKDELQVGYSFTFEYLNNSTKLISDENAIIEISNIKVGTNIIAFHEESEQKLFPQTFICQDNQKEYTLVIPAPEPEPEPEIEIEIEEPEIILSKPIKVKLIDHKNRPIENQEIEFKHKEKDYKLTTNNEGYCELNIEGIERDEIIKALVKIQKKKRSK